MSSLGHTPRACDNCAKSKQKCDRASPCGRCRQRKLQCESPPDSHCGPDVAVERPRLPSGFAAGSENGRHPAVEDLGLGETREMNRRRFEAGPSQNPTPSSALQISDVVMDSPESPHAHYLGLPVDSIDGITESGSRNMPGVCHLSDTDNTAQHGGVTEAEFSAVMDGSPNSWFDPFSVLDTEDWLPRLSPWDYSVDPRLDTLPCDDSRPASAKPQAHPEADHVLAPQVGVGSHSPRDLQEHTDAESLSTVTSRTPYSREGRYARAASQHLICFPNLLLSDVHIIVAENYYHVPALPEETYQIIRSFACSLRDTSSHSPEGHEFPDIDVLNSFMQLYFEFVNAQFPLLHRPTFKPSPKSWMLVLAVVAVGCCHSAIRNQHEFAVPLRDLLHKALVIELCEEPCMDGDLMFGQTVLLHKLLMVFSGTTRASLQSQSMKSVLVTLFQPFNSGDGSLFHRSRTPSSAQGNWVEWVEHESWNRLMYFTWCKFL
ncbi:hypothetical protein LB505_010133 [Fusarium chuoi]|nr:hypothetical protein LB505_010133 [Fusarium chuoi]